jgi:hypothetical protein
MFTLQWTPEARGQYDALRMLAAASLAARQKNNKTKATADEGLFKQAHKCATLLADNPRHPGLRTHQYHGLEHPFEKDGKVFEAYVQNRTPGAYRLFWCYGPGSKEITVIAITPHP